MKIRHLTASFILAVGFVMASAFTALAAVPTGRLEKVTDTEITGWAWQKDMPNTPITVRVAVLDEDGTEVFSQKITSSQYRDDLEMDGKGNGCHGFSIPIDWSALEDVYKRQGFMKRTEGRKTPIPPSA